MDQSSTMTCPPNVIAKFLSDQELALDLNGLKKCKLEDFYHEIYSKNYLTFSDQFVEVLKKLFIEIESADYVYRCLRNRVLEFMLLLTHEYEINEENGINHRPYEDLYNDNDGKKKKKKKKKEEEKKRLRFCYDITMFQDVFEYIILEYNNKIHLKTYISSKGNIKSFDFLVNLLSFPSISFLEQTDLWLMMYSHFFLENKDGETNDFPKVKRTTISKTTIQLIEVYLMCYLDNNEKKVGSGTGKYFQFSKETKDRICKCYEILHSIFQNLVREDCLMMKYPRSMVTISKFIEYAREDAGEENSTFSGWIGGLSIEKQIQEILIHLFKIKKKKGTEESEDEEYYRPFLSIWIENFGDRFKNTPFFMPPYQKRETHLNNYNRNKDEEYGYVHQSEGMMDAVPNSEFTVFFNFVETLLEVDFPSELLRPCLPVIFETCTEYFEKTALEERRTENRETYFEKPIGFNPPQPAPQPAHPKLKVKVRTKSVVMKILDFFKYVDGKYSDWDFCDVLVNRSRERITSFFASLARYEHVYEILPNRLLMQLIEIISIVLRNEMKVDYKSMTSKREKEEEEEEEEEKVVEEVVHGGWNWDVGVSGNNDRNGGRLFMYNRQTEWSYNSNYSTSFGRRRKFKCNLEDVIVPLISVISSKKVFTRFARTFERCKLIQLASQIFEIVKSITQEEKGACEVLLGTEFRKDLGSRLTNLEEMYGRIDFENIETAIEFLRSVSLKDEEINEEKVDLYITKAETSWMNLEKEDKNENKRKERKLERKEEVVSDVNDVRDFSAIMILFDRASKMKENIFFNHKKKKNTNKESLMRRFTKVLINIPFGMKNNKSKIIHLSHVRDTKYFLKKRNLIGEIGEEDVEIFRKNTILELKKLIESRPKKKNEEDDEEMKMRMKSIVEFAVTMSIHPSFKIPELFKTFTNVWFECYGPSEFFMNTIKVFFSRMNVKDQAIHGQDFLDWMVEMVERSEGFDYIHKSGFSMEISDVCVILNKVFIGLETITEILDFSSAIRLLKTLGRYLQNDLLSIHHLRIVQTILGFLKQYGTSGQVLEKSEEKKRLGAALLDFNIIDSILKMTYLQFPKNSITYNTTELLLLIIKIFPQLFFQQSDSISDFNLTKKIFEYIFHSKYVSDRKLILSESRLYEEKTTEVILRIIDLFHKEGKLVDGLVKKRYFGKVVTLVRKPFESYLASSTHNIDWKIVGTEEEEEPENDNEEDFSPESQRPAELNFDGVDFGQFPKANSYNNNNNNNNNEVGFNENEMVFGFDDETNVTRSESQNQGQESNFGDFGNYVFEN